MCIVGGGRRALVPRRASNAGLQPSHPLAADIVGYSRRWAMMKWHACSAVERAIDSIQEAIYVLAPAPGTVPKAPDT
jgi:hypothetical protein